MANTIRIYKKLNQDFCTNYEITYIIFLLLTLLTKVSFDMLLNDVIKILETGNSIQKINALESIATLDISIDVIKYVISKLDDDDIRVRGEAFSSLLLNPSEKISEYLINSLNSTSKNIRGFASLALANRNDTDAIPELIRLVCDERSMVRSCAIGALGYLGAKSKNVQEILYNALLDDDDIKVRMSAAYAIIRTDTVLPAKLLDAVDDKWKDDAQDESDFVMLIKRLRTMQQQVA